MALNMDEFELINFSLLVFPSEASEKALAIESQTFKVRIPEAHYIHVANYTKYFSRIQCE